jgi:peroxiredoxin Q/BCP
MYNQIKNIMKILFVLLVSVFSFLSCRAQELTLKEGDDAPDFTLQTDEGKTVKLSDYKGVSNVVLYFYPKDQTPGCTKEACTYRDNISKFMDYNTQVLGISVDDAESHKSFKEKESLNFPLLADPDKEVTKRYGVLNQIGLASRTTFVIDKEGKIKKIFVKVDPAENYKDVLEVLKTM